MRKYRIIDRQGMGTHVDEVFDCEEEIREHLLSYHSVDWAEDFPITKMSLQGILEYGEWDIEEVEITTIQCAFCGESFEYEETGTVDTMPDGYFLNNPAHEWICDECGSCPDCGTTLEKEPEKRGIHAQPCKNCAQV